MRVILYLTYKPAGPVILQSASRNQLEPADRVWVSLPVLIQWCGMHHGTLPRGRR